MRINAFRSGLNGGGAGARGGPATGESALTMSGLLGGAGPAGWVKMLTGSPTEINHYGAVGRQKEDLLELLLDQTVETITAGPWALLSSSDAASSRDIQH